MLRRSFRLAILVSHLVLFASAGPLFAQAAPQLASAVSRKAHGASNFDVPLPLTGGSGIECRNVSSGMTVVLFFDQPVNGGAAATSVGSVNGAPTFQDNTMTVKLAGIGPAATVTLTVTNVTATQGGGVLASKAIPFRTLLGDVNADGGVSAADVNTTKARSGGPVNGFTYRSDLNGDGAISVGDVNSTKARAGTTIAGGPMANTPPTIGDLVDQSVFSGRASPAVGFAVADAESALDSLAVKATSSNPSVLANSGITFGGTGGNRTISLSPPTGATGTTTVTVTVGDGLAVASDTFEVTVSRASTLFVAVLTPQGAAQSTGSGVSTLVLDGDELGATVRLSYGNLTTTKTGIHIHGPADPGQSGQILFDVDDAVPQMDGSLRWVFAPDSNGTYTVADIANWIKTGKTYINVHTANYPNGEIRGQYGLASGSQTFTPPPAPPSLPPGPPTAKDAARFLTQATFGPTLAEIARVQSIDLNPWLDDQFAKPTTSMYQTVYTRCTTSAASGDQLDQARITETWWKNAITAPDQLRQRVAFAYSEIFVVSEIDEAIAGQPAGLATYHDMLANDAFGNFRTLLKDVTLHPIMGRYLNMKGNKKPTSPNFTAPNENYAREVLQLFSIGVNQLQPDGTLKLDADGLPISTYDQTTVQGFAHVFTGWDQDPVSVDITTAQLDTNGQPIVVKSYYNKPMVVNANNHSTQAKQLLNGVTIPSTSSATVTSSNAELDAALDNIFNHPNVGPFICRQLIQRLVGSNPSPAYVYRVAQKFENDGTGVRGNMQAVIRATLTDYEARSTSVLSNPGYGHLREPLLRATAVLRAFHPTSTSGLFKIGSTDNNLFQTPYRSPTVFNFFEPGYIEPGELAAAGLVAPEFQITAETSAITTSNFLQSGIQSQFSSDAKIDLTAADAGSSSEQTLASNANLPQLLDRLDLLLMSGQMPAAMRTTISNHVQSLAGTTSTDLLNRAKAAVHLTATSAQFAGEK